MRWAPRASPPSSTSSSELAPEPHTRQSQARRAGRGGRPAPAVGGSRDRRLVRGAPPQPPAERPGAAQVGADPARRMEARRRPRGHRPARVGERCAASRPTAAERSRPPSGARTTTSSTPRSPGRRRRPSPMRLRAQRRERFSPARKLRLWIAGDSLVVVPGRVAPPRRRREAPSSSRWARWTGASRAGSSGPTSSTGSGSVREEPRKTRRARDRPHVRRQRRPRLHDRPAGG